MDGLYFKQGLNTGLLSLCVEGDRENAALLKCERKRAETSYGFKKNVENIIFWGYFHSKENIVKVILLFTSSYLSKDNSLMDRKEGELKGLHCRGSGPGGIVLC